MLFRSRVTKVGRVNAASPVNGQIGHPRAQAFEKVARFDYRRMLDPGGDDVIALIAQSEEHALEREIISLAAAACENNFIRVAVEQCCDLLARRLQRSLCLNRSPMPARRISVMVFEKCSHRRCHSWVDRRASVVIKINALHDRYT